MTEVLLIAFIIFAISCPIDIYLALFVAALYFFVVLLIHINIAINNYVKRKNKDKIKKKKDDNIDQVIDHSELIKKFFPSMTEDEILDILYNNYLVVKKAVMDFDYKTLKAYCTDDLYEAYKSDLDMLKSNGQKRILTDYNLKFYTIRDIRKENNIIIIDMYLRISFRDYVINEVTEEIIRGKKGVINNNQFILTFVAEDSLNESLCPNCGSNFTGKECPYCHTAVKSIGTVFLLSTDQDVY